MKRAVLSLAMFVALAPTSASSEAARPISGEDAYLIVASLLALPTGETGLARYKQMEAVRVRLGSPKTIDEFAVWLFIGFAAEARASVHTQEEYAHSIRSVYESSPELFLGAIARSEFLAPYACEELGASFSFVGKANELTSFVGREEPRIRKLLRAQLAEECLESLRIHAA